VDIIFSPKSIARLFLVIVICLILAHMVGLFFRDVLHQPRVFVPLVDLNGEGSIPTFYSGVSMIVCAAFLGLIGLVKRKQRQPYAFHWLFLGAIFLYLAVDEVVMLHEKLHKPMVKLLNLHGLLYVGWVVPYAVAMLILAAVYFNFVRRLPRRTRNLFLVAGFVYVAGAAGIEAVSGARMELYSSKDVIYKLIYTVEEILELFGILIFIYALADYIDAELKGLRIIISAKDTG
jgi:hypothetical protein